MRQLPSRSGVEQREGKRTSQPRSDAAQTSSCTIFSGFNRRSTVSLSGSLGEVRLGRDYTPTFWNDTVFDPFGSNGVGSSILLTANGYSSSGATTNGFTANGNYARASNSIGYFLPRDLGGFYGQAMLALNEKTSYDPGSLTPPGAPAIARNPALAAVADNARAGLYWGVRGGYASGALDVAIAYAQSTVASNYYLGTTTSLDIWNLGASYDFGVVKLFGEYSNNKQDTQRVFSLANFQKPGANGWLLGATVPVGPGLIRIAYSAVNYNNVTRLNQVFGLTDDPQAEKWAVGYVHNLSRRTALYATVASIRNKNGVDLILGGPNFYQATPATGVLIPKSSTGYDFGIRHVF